MEFCLSNGANTQLSMLLVERGGHVNLPEPCQGYTPLMWAAYHGDQILMDFLLDNGADVNAKTQVRIILPAPPAALQHKSDL